MKWWDWMPWSLFSECWALSQLFHSPLSLSSRGSLVVFFIFCHKGGVICISEIINISSSNLDSSCASSSPAFLMMYSAYKLNKQGDNIQQYTALMFSFSYLEPLCCSMSSSNCCFLTCIQVSQDAGQVVWYSQLLQFSSLLWSTQSKALA